VVYNGAEQTLREDAISGNEALVEATIQSPVSAIRRWPRRAFALLAVGLVGTAVATGSELAMLSAIIAAVASALLSYRQLAKETRTPPSGLLSVSVVVFGVAIFLLVDFCWVHLIEVKTAVDVKQISMAILNYSDAHQGEWLAPAICDVTGRPLLSWRVAILPFIDENDLYKQFHLDEPWDSQHNLALLPRMPRIYAAANGAADAYTTPYQAFVGPGTALEGPGLRFPRDFPDGSANTILIVEARDTVPWTKPVDLLFDPLGPLPTLGRAHLPGRLIFGAQRQQDVAAHITTVDGGARLLRPGISEATLRAAITRNGNDELGPDW
jgi:hypothetical protein